MRGVAQNLVSGFLATSERIPTRPALEVEGRVLSYAELHGRAVAIADALLRELPEADPPLTAVFGHRTATAFAGILGTLLRGHGYVPLNPTFPPERTAFMLNRSGCQAVIVDKPSLEQLSAALERLDRPLVVVGPDLDSRMKQVGLDERGHRFLTAEDLDHQAKVPVPEVDPSSIAYLLFTSGSTGQPKGVMVAHRNVRHFLDFMTGHYGVVESDRFSQTFDLTFDLSVFDMFVAWERGATLCCPSAEDLLRPDRYIDNAGLTVWFAVPSLGIYMNRLGMLKPQAYPSLRISLFCGEPLPLEVADAWAASAPESIVENLYGPTELTIACTLYQWDRERARAESERGIVPIGSPYPGMEPLIVGDDLRMVPDGSAGELLMAGPQMTLGYWKDEERTNAAFVTPPGQTRRFYRTGDRVRARDKDGPLLYLGRVDHQIKVRGFRVELGEIEAALRDASGLSGAVAVGWPLTPSGAAGIEAFLEGAEPDIESIVATLRSRLPEYMVPRRIHSRDRLPLNPNGKYDRSALLSLLEAGL